MGSGAVPPADAVGAFNRGLAVAAIRERRESTGLDRFHAEGHDNRINSYVQSSRQVRTLLREAIPAGLLSKPPFRHDSLRGDAALLSRELDKQRRALGIRALLKRYPTVVASDPWLSTGSFERPDQGRRVRAWAKQGLRLTAPWPWPPITAVIGPPEERRAPNKNPHQEDTVPTTSQHRNDEPRDPPAGVEERPEP